MGKYVETVEGAGITKRLKKRIHHDPRTPQGAAAIVNFFRSLSTLDPWGQHQPAMEAVTKALEVLRIEEAPEQDWKPRQHVGWYLRHILPQNTLVRHYIDKGQASHAAHEAAILGETWAELQMKLVWERDALAGRKSYEGARQGAKARSSSDKIQDRRAVFFEAFDDAVGRNVPPTMARQRAAKAASYNDDYTRKLLSKR